MVKPQTVSVVTSSCEAYLPLLQKYNWDVSTALRIIGAESGCSSVGHNPTDQHRDRYGNIICLGSWGLFNIGCVHGYSMKFLESPTNNIKVAYNIYIAAGSSWGDWTTY